MYNHIYTPEDFSILNSYKNISISLGKYLGDNVEIVIYSELSSFISAYK